MDSPESKKILFVGRTQEDCRLAKEQLGERLLIAKDCFAGAALMKHKEADLLLMDASGFFPRTLEKYAQQLKLTKEYCRPRWENALRNDMAQKVVTILEMGDFWATILIATKEKQFTTIVNSVNSKVETKAKKDYALIIRQIDALPIVALLGSTLKVESTP